MADVGGRIVCDNTTDKLAKVKNPPKHDTTKTKILNEKTMCVVQNKNSSETDSISRNSNTFN